MRTELIVQDLKGITEIKKDRKNRSIVAAERLLVQMKQKIVRKYPIVSYVLHYMEFIPVEEDIYLETDGQNIFYSPRKVLEVAKRRHMEELEYRCMHILAHGMLGHFELAVRYEKSSVMHTLMDLEVYKFLNRLGTTCDQKVTFLGMTYMIRLLGDNRGLMPIYRESVQSPTKKKDILRCRTKLIIDDHKVWYRNRKFRYMIDIPDQGSCHPVSGDDEKKNRMDAGRMWAYIRRRMFGRSQMDMQELYEVLRDSRAGRSVNYGCCTGDDEYTVKAADRAALNYAGMLEKFLKNREKSIEDAESIDKIMYAWGLDTYGDVAFVEPCPESDIKKLNTVVLAIDTSGSCSGEVMERFVAETKKLFKQLKGAWFGKFVVLQCDADIKKADVYKNISELPGVQELEDGMTMYGFGGTSFMPVFDYVDELVASGENIDCLIYLTDGYGDYPDSKNRAYETFFVLDRVDDDMEDDGDDFIPEWINKVYLTA